MRRQRDAEGCLISVEQPIALPYALGEMPFFHAYQHRAFLASAQARGENHTRVHPSQKELVWCDLADQNAAVALRITATARATIPVRHWPEANGDVELIKR